LIITTLARVVAKGMQTTAGTTRETMDRESTTKEATKGTIMGTKAVGEATREVSVPPHSKGSDATTHQEGADSKSISPSRR